jgi:hypothetical protein
MFYSHPITPWVRLRFLNDIGKIFLKRTLCNNPSASAYLREGIIEDFEASTRPLVCKISARTDKEGIPNCFPNSSCVFIPILQILPVCVLKFRQHVLIHMCRGKSKKARNTTATHLKYNGFSFIGWPFLEDVSHHGNETVVRNGFCS